MRDVKRIDILLEELKKYWMKEPDLRLGQILHNIGYILNCMEDSFYLEDDDLIDALKKINSSSFSEFLKSKGYSSK